MGYVTPILIRNDGLHDITNNPKEFVSNLYDIIQHGEDASIPVGGFANVAEVLRTKHADTRRVLLVTGNTMFDIGNIPQRDTLRDYFLSEIKIAKSLISYCESELKKKG